MVDGADTGTLGQSIRKAVHVAHQVAPADNQIDVHIVGSVAGGTGAGWLIDTAAQVNKEFMGNRAGVSIVGMLVLPDAFAGVLEGRALERARANGFATLRELNRLMCHPKRAQVGQITLGYQILDICYLLSGHRRFCGRSTQDMPPRRYPAN